MLLNDIEKSKRNSLFKKYVYSLKSVSGITMTVMCVLSLILIFMRLGMSMKTLSYAILLIVLSIVSIEDIKNRIIANHIIYVGWVLGVIAAVVVEMNFLIVNKLIAFAVCGSLLLIVYLITKGGIGMGDVKLFSCVGLYLGIKLAFTALFCSVLLTLLAGLALVILRKYKMKDTLPFAPFIYLGVILTLIL